MFEKEGSNFQKGRGVSEKLKFTTPAESYEWVTMVSQKMLTSQEEELYIKSFCRQIIREKSGNYPPLKRSRDGTLVYPSAAGITTNRGNKLLQGSELVTRQILNSSKPINESCVYYNGSEHNLLQRRKRVRFSPTSEYDTKQQKQENEEDSDYSEDDLSSIVDVRKILTPISSLADISKNDALKRPFESKILRDLALQSLLMIEKEQSSVIRYSKLLEVFLGDDPEPLYEATLKLAPYDHNLKLPEEEDMTDVVDKETYTKQDEKEGQDEDPFFAVPNIGGAEALLSLLPEAESPEVADDVEMTRQLAQIALQRNQEFIRNLQKIKNSLIKANRIRERILAWSREYAGIPEEGVTIPNALRVVKRGLISATTNRSMGRVANAEEDAEQENELE